MATSACPADTTPPSTPTNLHQSGSTATSVTVSWTASTDNVGVTGYGAYKNGSLAGSATTTSYTFNGLTCGTSYTLAVDAADAAGNRSAQTSTTLSTNACPDTTPPTTPTGLTTSGIAETSITLSWTASSDNVGVTGYRLYLGGNQVGTSTSASYLFSGLTCGTSYTLGVAAVDAAGNVSGTATISATTAGCSGSGGGNFSGTFDCYGSTPNCTGLSPKTCTTTISAASLQSTLNSATGGAVICVNAGSTGNISLSSKTYSSVVTVQPASTATVTVGNVSLTSVRRLNFTGVGNSSGTAATMAMGQVHIDTEPAATSPSITSPLRRRMAVCPINDNGPDSNILFDHERLDNMETENVGGCLAEGSISMWGGGGSPGWLTISNSHFGGNTLPGCSDGIQIGGDGAKIGPGNEFTGKFQGNCVAHSDPLQFYAPSGVNNNIVTGNWFHNNTTGCMCWERGRQQYVHQQRL